MVAYAAAAAREAELSKVVVSTDDARIAAACEPFGAEWIRRPSAICGPHARIEDAIQHALAVSEEKDCVRYDYVVALQAAVPVRPYGAIRCLLDTVISGNARGGITVVRRSPWMWNLSSVENGGACSTWWNPKEGYPRSQDVTTTTLEEVNGIMIVPRAEALAGKRYSSPLAMIELPKFADHDIDGPEDLKECQDDWPTIANRLHKPKYQWHIVNNPKVPKVQIPPDDTFGRVRTGVILGNGPQIDTLGAEFWRKISDWNHLSIGVNRICCAETPLKYGFAPDMHLVWDSGNRGNPLTEAQRAGLEKLDGRTWRLISHEPYARCYPHDQVLENDDRIEGPPRAAKLFNVSTDAALNLLYRMGVREFYIYGVEMNDNQHCKVAGLDESKFEVPWASDEQLQKGLDAWRKVINAHPDAKIYCACETSQLVKRGVMEFRAIDTARNYE
jgi:CMP-N-acetylneuraminic acid synthetase